MNVLMAQNADALIYFFEVNDPIHNPAAGHIDYFTATYNTGTEQLQWETRFSPNSDGMFPNGFWLVLSDGPNPKNHFNEYAIFYGDTINNKLTTYVYSGENSGNSWFNPGEFIQASSTDLYWSDAGGQRTIGFQVATSFINVYTPTTPGTNDWDGAQFGEELGIWFHPTILTQVSYGDNWQLTEFSFSQQGWYDAHSLGTEIIPEPASLALLSLGLGGIGFIRRKKKRS